MRHLILLLLLTATAARAQQLQVVNTTGNVLGSAAMTVEYSVGEVSVATLLAGQDAATQGFIQPSDPVDCSDPAIAAGLALAGDLAEVTPQNPVVTLHLLGNDQLPGGFSPLLSAYTQGAKGSVMQADSVTLTYTLKTPGFSGLDSFIYTVCLDECLQAVCDTASVYIAVRSNLTDDIRKLIPNAITPNDDGLNDTFDPLPILWDNGLFYPEDQVELFILNRWSEVVFHVQPYQPWEGRGINGQSLPVATYYYNLRLHGFSDTQELKGAVQVLK